MSDYWASSQVGHTSLYYRKATRLAPRWSLVWPGCQLISTERENEDDARSLVCSRMYLSCANLLTLSRFGLWFSTPFCGVHSRLSSAVSFRSALQEKTPMYITCVDSHNFKTCNVMHFWISLPCFVLRRTLCFHYLVLLPFRFCGSWSGKSRWHQVIRYWKLIHWYVYGAS